MNGVARGKLALGRIATWTSCAIKRGPEPHEMRDAGLSTEVLSARLLDVIDGMVRF
jgi:hypothetical protein